MSRRQRHNTHQTFLSRCCQLRRSHNAAADRTSLRAKRGHPSHCTTTDSPRAVLSPIAPEPASRGKGADEVAAGAAGQLPLVVVERADLEESRLQSKG